MKFRVLLLALVAAMSLLGARDAVCERPPSRYVSRFKPPRTKVNKPQRTKVTRKPSIDNNLIEVTDDLQEFLDSFGPYNPGPTIPKPNPGPTFPEPDIESLIIEALVNILLAEQYGPEYDNYDEPGSASTDPGPIDLVKISRKLAKLCPGDWDTETWIREIIDGPSCHRQIRDKQGPELPDEELP